MNIHIDHPEMRNNTLLIEMANSEIVKETIVKTLKPLVEVWSNEKLSSDVVIWGIRRYLRGATLAFHVDRLPTHVLSVVLQVLSYQYFVQKKISHCFNLLFQFFQISQSVQNNWPLNLIDLKGNQRKIYMKPGEMLFYESAKVFHGRQEPLQGEFFDNVFVHFHPKFNPQLRKFVSVFSRQNIGK